MAAFASVIVGVLILFAGRRLFWLSVGVAGFVAGTAIVTTLFQQAADITVLVVALVVGLIGAFAAVFLQKIALGLAGFILGGYLAFWIIRTLAVTLGGWEWLFYLASGLTGSALVTFLFDWALIVLSSLTGATLLLQWARIRPAFGLALIAGLGLVGIVVQSRRWRRQRGR